MNKAHEVVDLLYLYPWLKVVVIMKK